MSSTGRGERLGGANDFYPTPAWCVQRLLEKWQPRPGTLVEPCVGDGAIVEAVNLHDLAQGWFTWGWFTCDIKSYPGFEPALLGDFLSIDRDAFGGRDVSVVITNPPYILAEEFLRKSRTLYPKADLVFLLRIGFLCSEERLGFFADFGVPDLYFLPNRPSFGHGSDSSEYAWFIFPPIPQKTGEVIVLDSTPRDVRHPKKLRGQKCPRVKKSSVDLEKQIADLQRQLLATREAACV